MMQKSLLNDITNIEKKLDVNEMTTKIIIDKEDLIELIRMSGLNYEDSKSLLDSKNKKIVVYGFQTAGDVCIIDYIGD